MRTETYFISLAHDAARSIGQASLATMAHEEVTAEQVADLPRIITQHEFRTAAAQMDLNDSHTTRAWDAAINIYGSSIGRRFESAHNTLEIDLVPVLQHMRSIERGEHFSRWGLGQTYWNLLAGVINMHVGQPGEAPVVLPWDPTIHPYLINKKCYRHVARLEENYRFHKEAAAEARRQGVLF